MVLTLGKPRWLDRLAVCVKRSSHVWRFIPKHVAPMDTPPFLSSLPSLCSRSRGCCYIGHLSFLLSLLALGPLDSAGLLSLEHLDSPASRLLFLSPSVLQLLPLLHSLAALFSFCSPTSNILKTVIYLFRLYLKKHTYIHSPCLTPGITVCSAASANAELVSPPSTPGPAKPSPASKPPQHTDHDHQRRPGLLLPLHRLLPHSLPS